MNRNSRNYEERIGKLRACLQTFANGEIGYLNIPSVARKAIEEDEKISNEQWEEAGED